MYGQHIFDQSKSLIQGERFLLRESRLFHLIKLTQTIEKITIAKKQISNFFYFIPHT